MVGDGKLTQVFHCFCILACILRIHILHQDQSVFVPERRKGTEDHGDLGTEGFQGFTLPLGIIKQYNQYAHHGRNRQLSGSDAGLDGIRGLPVEDVPHQIMENLILSVQTLVVSAQIVSDNLAEHRENVISNRVKIFFFGKKEYISVGITAGHNGAAQIGKQSLVAEIEKRSRRDFRAGQQALVKMLHEFHRAVAVFQRRNPVFRQVVRLGGETQDLSADVQGDQLTAALFGTFRQKTGEVFPVNHHLQELRILVALVLGTEKVILCFIDHLRMIGPGRVNQIRQPAAL